VWQGADFREFLSDNILILEHLAAHPTERIELAKLIPRWQERLKTWRAWMCTQSKQTNEQVVQGMPLDRIGGNCEIFFTKHIISIYHQNFIINIIFDLFIYRSKPMFLQRLY
jgi:hypothetical protein